MDRSKLIRMKLEFLDINEIQKFVTVYRELEKRGINIEHLETVLEEERQNFIRTEGTNLPAVALCPDCKQPLRILPVNTDNRTQTGDPNDRSVRVCSNPQCLYTDYSQMTVKQWQQKIVKIMRGGK